VSVLDAPNVSSNVISSTVALWFRLGGPNLMVCSGATAGLDGLGLAALLLRARRADRVVLVGAEPADDVAAALRPGIRAGAACVVLEPAGRAAGPGVTVGGRGAGPAIELGDFYGANGVVALALACHLVTDEGFAEAGVLDVGEGARRTAVVRAPGAGR
jgi:hypothetical protein